jgi:multiple sugar transport system substrate-binding protein
MVEEDRILWQIATLRRSSGPSTPQNDGGRIGRREFLRAAGAAVAGLAIGGCGPNRGSTPGGEPVQLVYQDWRTEWFPPMAQEMLAEFHAAHPDIRVFYTPDPEQFVEQMTQDLRAGTAPDVFQGCCTHFPAWAQQGYVLDLRPYVEADLDAATIDDWDPAQFAALSTEGGLQFGLPKYHGALALYFNKDLFDEYKVDYPDGSWDHDDYASAMRSLADDRDGDGEVDQWGSAIDVSWDRVQVHVNAWGGHLVDPRDPTVSRMAEPEALGALEWLRARILDDHALATRLDLGNMSLPDAFAAGRIAMSEDGSWALKAVLTGADFRIGVAPFPRGPARRVTIATTDGFGIYAGTNHPDEAWELLKFLISPEYGRAMASANLLQPARRSLVEEWARFVRDAYPEKAEGVDIQAFAAGHNEGYSVTAEIFANMTAATALAYDAWDEILVLGAKPVSYMETVSAEITAQQGGE